MVGVLLKEINQTKAAIARRRATLKAEWQQLDAAAIPLGRAEEAIFAGVIAKHQLLQALSRQRLQAEEEAARSDRAASALQACVTQDLLALKEVLKLPFDSSQGAVSLGMPQLDRMRENKQAIHARLMRQIDRADALRNEAAKHAEKAAEAVRKNEALMRSLAGGHKMFVFDPQHATLAACEVWLQPDAEGRARLLCGFADRRSLEVHLSTIDAVGPAYPNAGEASGARRAPARGAVRCRPRRGFTGGSAGMQRRTARPPPVPVEHRARQLVANRRETPACGSPGCSSYAGWASGRPRARRGSGAGQPGLASARLMVSQQARDHGKSPGKALEALVRTADFVQARRRSRRASPAGMRRPALGVGGGGGGKDGDGDGGPAVAAAPPARLRLQTAWSAAARLSCCLRAIRTSPTDPCESWPVGRNLNS